VIPADLPLDAQALKPTKRPVGITLQQMRIFVAVVRADTLTRAAKDLGLAQPSLSQQISRLEEIVGTRLFERRSSQMLPTEAGQFLYQQAEPILVKMRELEDGMADFSVGRRQTLRIAGINSILRMVLPEALRAVQQRTPGLTLDISEQAPNEVLDMLLDRRANIGIVGANSLPADAAGLVQVPVLDDPYVLAVPKSLDLSGVSNPETDLTAAERTTLNSTIQFVFGTRHQERIEDWFGLMVPHHRVAMQCRTFEVAMGMVQGGLGVCLCPALSALSGGTANVRLYRINAPARKVVALVPSQFRRVEPYGTVLDELSASGARFTMPDLLPTPPFLAGGEAFSL
jgi:DNA-binding transcriptional LysR family regulator